MDSRAFPHAGMLRTSNSDKCPNGVKTSGGVVTLSDDCLGAIGCLRSARLQMAESEGQSFRGNVEPDNLARKAGHTVHVGSGIEHLSNCLVRPLELF